MNGMNLYQSQFRRLALLDREIRRRKHPNAFTFASEYGVSRRTVARDIQLLKERGAPIEYDPTENGYFYTDRSWSLPAMEVSEGELLQLLVAERMATQYRGTPIAKGLEALFEKLFTALPDTVSVDPGYVSDEISFHAVPSRPVDEKTWSIVLRSLRSLRALRFQYSPVGTEKVVTRTVEPVHMACIADEWYLVAHCTERCGLRHFSIARIKKAELLKKTYDPHTFKPEEYFSNRFGRYIGEPGETYQIAVRFTKSAAPWILERTWHPKQTVKKNRDGSITLSFPAPALYEVKRWVLSWGAEAEVLKPKELKDEVSKELRATAVLYR
jgi:predicted DNA-binding transcriptional regulator YafY